MNEKRRAFYETLDGQLDEWTAMIDRLKDQSATAKSQVASEYTQLMTALEAKRSEAWTALKALKASGDESWEDLEQALQNTLEEGKAACRAAVARFKSPVG